MTLHAVSVDHTAQEQATGGRSPGVEFMTMGCRLNAFETEVMRAHAEAAGLGAAVIVNTCAVTAEAVRQATQSIRRIRRERPGVRIIVTGCAAQISPERFAALPEVDHVIGNAEKLNLATFQSLAAAPAVGAEAGAQTPAPPGVQVGDIMTVRQTALHLIDGFANRARACIEIQNGCDHRCTFCIIPFGRGPSRSVPEAAVVAQVRHLVSAGIKEIVLTGVDITSYGGDLLGQPKLGSLVRQILAQVPELPRLRLSSIDQVEADGDLFQALAEEPRLMPHLHLSLQSGDDMILKRMKRRHQRADAVAFCQRVRQLRPDVVFGADIIAGFPTETGEMFQRSIDLVDDCGLTYIHAFPFSPRPGTPAARMPQVGRPVAKARAAQLRNRGDAVLAQFLRAQVNTTTPVLVELDGTGRTPHFAEVEFVPALPPAPEARHGRLVVTRITGVDGSGRKLSGQAL